MSATRDREPATYSLLLDAIALRQPAATGQALVMVPDRRVAILVQLHNVDLTVIPPAQDVIEIELRGRVS